MNIRQLVAYRVLLSATKEIGYVDVRDQGSTKAIPIFGESICKSDLRVKTGWEFAESGIEIVTETHMSILQLEHRRRTKCVRIAGTVVLGWKFGDVGKFRSAAGTILVVTAG